MIEMNPSTYFAAANTAKGFQSYFQDIFSPDVLESIYILKGGPGTGKSSFMRIVSKMAQDAGFTVEEFLCSSDPKSLDAVLIPEKKMAILDGTAPHLSDPIYPGVVESIINTGAFWDRSKLFEKKNEIISLIKDKKRHFKRGYQFLMACGEIESDLQKLTDSFLIKEKMNASIDRIAKQHFKKESDAKTSVRLIGAINGCGCQKLDTFINNSTQVYVIEDFSFSANFYLQKLYDKALAKRQQMTYSRSCQFPDLIDALYFPEQKLTFVIGQRDYEKELCDKQYHYINMARFIDKEKTKEHKQKMKFGKRCADMLRSGAIEAFSDAQKTHFELEKMYTAALDFSKFEESVKSFVQELKNR